MCKSITVRFTTFRHRTAFYRAWKSIGKIAQVRLDLTKRWYDILKAGNEYIKSIGHTAKFCYADINCRMKIKWGDNSEEFFESLQDLKDLVDENCWKLEYVNFVVLEVHVYTRCLSFVEVFWTDEWHLVWQKVLYLITSWGVSRTQPSRTQPSGMELLAKTVNSLRPMAVFIEIFFFDVWLGSEWASAICKGAP